MARRAAGSPPSYRLHRQSGQAIVSLPVGGGRYRDLLLGRFGSHESRAEYARVIAEWVASRVIPPARTGPGAGPNPSINEVLAAYTNFAATYYVKNGKPTNQLDRVRRSLEPVRELYGFTKAADFGPLALKAVRQRMIERGWCRNLVNSYIGCVKRCFRWAVENELVPPHVWHGLQAVRGLLRGRTAARETEPIGPVPEEQVEAVLPHLTAPVRAMVELQRFTGMRPCEVLIVRPCDVDTSGEVWTYTPSTHKTEHHGLARVVHIGPRGQAALRPFLADRAPAAFCFSPREAVAEFCRRRRESRKSKVWPSHQRRYDAQRAVAPKRAPRDQFTTRTYGGAIERACVRAGVPAWAPNQLRHSFATEVRRAAGIDPARAILGHRSAVTTEIYAEQDRRKAAEVIKAIG